MKCLLGSLFVSSLLIPISHSEVTTPSPVSSAAEPSPTPDSIPNIDFGSISVDEDAVLNVCCLYGPLHYDETRSRRGDCEKRCEQIQSYFSNRKDLGKTLRCYIREGRPGFDTFNRFADDEKNPIRCHYPVYFGHSSDYTGTPDNRCTAAKHALLCLKDCNLFESKSCFGISFDNIDEFERKLAEIPILPGQVKACALEQAFSAADPTGKFCNTATFYLNLCEDGTCKVTTRFRDCKDFEKKDKNFCYSPDQTMYCQLSGTDFDNPGVGAKTCCTDSLGVLKLKDCAIIGSPTSGKRPDFDCVCPEVDCEKLMDKKLAIPCHGYANRPPNATRPWRTPKCYDDAGSRQKYFCKKMDSDAECDYGLPNPECMWAICDEEGTPDCPRD